MTTHSEEMYELEVFGKGVPAKLIVEEKIGNRSYL